MATQSEKAMTHMMQALLAAVTDLAVDDVS